MSKEGQLRFENAGPGQKADEFKQFDENENIYKQMFEFSPFSILIHDLEMNIVDANQKAIEQFGFSKEELLEKKVSDLHPESELETSARVLEKVKVQDKLSVETSFLRKDGSKFLAEATPFKYRLKDKLLIHVYIEDITQQKEDEVKLYKALEKAGESDRLTSAFLANMSHEVRTPMNGIFGFLDLLKNANLSGEDQQKYIGIIEKSGNRMLNTINDIINVSKIESGLVDVNLHDTNINEQIECIYTLFHDEASGKGLEMSFKSSLPYNEAVVVTDQEKLFAILNNLVKNAIKHTDKGKIEFGYHIKDDLVEFYVTDTGVGIPEDRQEAIFERFIQADIHDRQAREGAGLGLTISKAYLEMLGGKMWIESRVDEGSTFYFSIPFHANKKKNKFRVSDQFKERKFNFTFIEEDQKPN